VKPITVLYQGPPTPEVLRSLERLAESDLIHEMLLVAPPGVETPASLGGIACTSWHTAEPGAWRTAGQVVDCIKTPCLLQVTPHGGLDVAPGALKRMLSATRTATAAIVYGDYCDSLRGVVTPHPLADHQPGSMSDRFDMGPLVMWRIDPLREVIERRGEPTDLNWHSWYEMRLRISLVAPVLHLIEPLCVREMLDQRSSGQAVFDYLIADRGAQLEAERVATEHLKRIGARVSGPFKPFVSAEPFPVEASVIIPVRDRALTITDAVNSALNQRAPFPFNVLVGDNHSTDGTDGILSALSERDDRLFHLVPTRRDLGIGGCWNEAIYNPACGRFAVQLDSDDTYDGESVLVAMVSALRDGQCGMAIGSYTTVDMSLKEVPPGLVDHREWSDANGPNNALRVEGLGAPRAFATDLVRRHPFPNVSYGEDYAVALRLSREYRVGRIYESLYYCRRWEDNTDADLSPEVVARHQTYKDRIRTLEIAARRERNKGRLEETL